MRIAVDANLLLRFVLHDDPEQARVAAAELKGADRVVLPLVALCEFVWVLRRSYGMPRDRVVSLLRALVEIDTAVCDDDAVEAGLALLERGGDFADGVIAHLGQRQGAEMLVTFDRDAVRHLAELGHPARLAGARGP